MENSDIYIYKQSKFAEQTFIVSNYFSLTKTMQPENKFLTLVHAFTENGSQGYNYNIIIIHHYNCELC